MPKKNETIRSKVEMVLQICPETRNDDRLLMLRYWEMVDGIDFDESFEDQFLTGATMPESIRRARQLIQEEGLYPPTSTVAAGRRRKQVRMHDAIVNEREVVE